MEWITVFASNASLLSVICIASAAAFICWKAGSLHPISSRLLHLFIRRDDVEDNMIRKSLRDQAALVSFRVAHGVRVHTLEDAKSLITFSDNNNVSLRLIARAGRAFDQKKLSVVPKRVPSRILLLVPMVVLLLCFIAAAVLVVASASSSILVSVKATGTWVWLSENDARLAFSPETTTTLRAGSCNQGRPSTLAHPGFMQDDVKVLCEVWQDPGISNYLVEELPKQRVTLLVLLLPVVWILAQSYLVLRQWTAAIELKASLST